ncbi:MAG: hypothetical protein HYX20_02955 [Candidatus Yanofskybacteria bacterium]|nr:hypothetical protein [Candidatus Yanofskybacteria bacterium]
MLKLNSINPWAKMLIFFLIFAIPAFYYFVRNGQVIQRVLLENSKYSITKIESYSFIETTVPQFAITREIDYWIVTLSNGSRWKVSKEKPGFWKTKKYSPMLGEKLDKTFIVNRLN